MINNVFPVDDGKNDILENVVYNVESGRWKCAISPLHFNVKLVYIL